MFTFLNMRVLLRQRSLQLIAFMSQVLNFTFIPTRCMTFPLQDMNFFILLNQCHTQLLVLVLQAFKKVELAFKLGVFALQAMMFLFHATVFFLELEIAFVH